MDIAVERLVDLSDADDNEVANRFKEREKKSIIETEVPCSPPIKTPRTVRSKRSDKIYENLTPNATSISIQSSSSSSDEKTQFVYASDPESLRRQKRRTRSQRSNTPTLSLEFRPICEGELHSRSQFIFQPEEFQAAGRPDERQRLLTSEEFAPLSHNTDDSVADTTQTTGDSGSEGPDSVDFKYLTIDEVMQGLPSRQPLDIQSKYKYFAFIEHGT